MSEQLLTVSTTLIVGYLLLAIEIFLVPGLGLPGVIGFLFLIAGCYFANDFFGITYGVVTIVAVLTSTTAMLVWFPKTRFGRNLVHSTALSKKTEPLQTLIEGQIGITESDLRPAGIARFGNQRESVVTEGEFISSDCRVLITEIRGSRIVVEAASPLQT